MGSTITVPAPPPDPHTDYTEPAAWSAAGAALIAALKYARDMFRSRKPQEDSSLHVGIAKLAVGLTELTGEVKTLRETIIQSHDRRIGDLELQRAEDARVLRDLIRRVKELEA